MDQLYQVFQGDLLKDENILWTGQPETSILFTRADIFLVPFSLLWGGFALFWEMSVLFIKDKSGQGPPIFFSLFGIPFVLMGLYFIFGRFIWKNFKKKRTYYAVTDKRVIVITKTFSKSIVAEFIDRIPGINKTVGLSGIGSIRFGNTSWVVAMYGNTGMDFFGAFYGQDIPVFYDIKDADRVYNMVSELRNK